MCETRGRGPAAEFKRCYLRGYIRACMRLQEEMVEARNRALGTDEVGGLETAITICVQRVVAAQLTEDDT